MKATSLVSFLYGVYQSPYEKNYSVGLRRVLCSLKWEDASLESSCHHDRSDEFAFRMWNIWAKSWKNQGSRKHTHHWVHGRVSKIWLPIDCETPVSVRRVALSCCWHFNYNGRSTIFKWEFSIAMLVFGGVSVSLALPAVHFLLQLTEPIPIPDGSSSLPSRHPLGTKASGQHCKIALPKALKKR